MYWSNILNILYNSQIQNNLKLFAHKKQSAESACILVHVKQGNVVEILP